MSERKPFDRLRLDESLRQWSGSPQEHALRERIRGLGIKVEVDLTPLRKRRRAKGAGRPSKLTAKQIEHGRTLLRDELANYKSVAKHAAAVAFLRAVLDLGERDVSDGVLKERIIRPVLRRK